ncbi:MAG: site-specific integrase [Alcaligenaceae bacterium]|nr:MAG: site-specific integrase [Alcaligenaceae bacterium]
MAKLTVRAIESAKPRSAPYKLTVDTGLYIRVPLSGDKRWIVKYVVAGKQREARLPKPYGANAVGAMSLADAIAENQRIQSLARAGVDFQEQASAAIEKARADALQQLSTLLPFNAMFEEWLDIGVSRKDGNAELRRAFGKDVLPALGEMPVKNITEKDLRTLLVDIVARGRNRMAVRTYRDLVQLFGWAEKRQPWRALLVEQNPAALLTIERIVDKSYDLHDERSRVLSAAEIRELRDIFARMGAAYESAENKRSASRGLKTESQIAVWLCLSTLCRIGELQMARWDQVDLEAGVWHIPKGNTKKTAGKQQDHTIYLSPFALRQFESLRKITTGSPWCFPARNVKAGDTHIDVKAVTKQIGDRQAQFKQRAALKNRTHDDSLVLSSGKAGEWTPHDLRRTGATMMQALGIGLDVIDRCQNHVLAGSKVRRAYMHHDFADETREAWQKLGNKIEGVLASSK